MHSSLFTRKQQWRRLPRTRRGRQQKQTTPNSSLFLNTKRSDHTESFDTSDLVSSKNTHEVLGRERFPSEGHIDRNTPPMATDSSPMTAARMPSILVAQQNGRQRARSSRRVSICETPPETVTYKDEANKFAHEDLWWTDQDFECFRRFSNEIFREYGTLQKLTPMDFMGGLNTHLRSRSASMPAEMPGYLRVTQQQKGPRREDGERHKKNKEEAKKAPITTLWLSM